jgi:hypothetical protein
MADASHTVIKGFEFDSIMLADPITGEAYSTIRDYAIEVGFQALQNHRRVIAIGNIPTADRGAPVDAWGGMGLYPWITGAVALEVIAGDAADTFTGTGAKLINVAGLDINFNEVSQTVQLNGTAAVTLPIHLHRINSVRVVGAGSGKTNASEIRVQDVGGGTVRAVVLAGTGTTRQSVFTVPAGWTLQIFSQLFGINRAAAEPTGPQPGGWVKIANEGEDFTVDGVKTVRFGEDTHWISLPVDSSGHCTNTFFGADPEVGVFKECQTQLEVDAPLPLDTPVFAEFATYIQTAGGVAVIPLSITVSDTTPYRQDGAPGITVTEKTDFCHRCVAVTADGLNLTAGWLGIMRLNPPINKLT